MSNFSWSNAYNYGFRISAAFPLVGLVAVLVAVTTVSLVALVGVAMEAITTTQVGEDTTVSLTGGTEHVSWINSTESRGLI